MITRNIGKLDKTLRIVVGLALIVLALTQTIGWWGLVGIVPLATALVNFCPLYRLVGIRTCKVSER